MESGTHVKSVKITLNIFAVYLVTILKASIMNHRNPIFLLLILYYYLLVLDKTKEDLESKVKP